MDLTQAPPSDSGHSEELCRHLEAVLRRHARHLNNRWWRWPLLGPSYHLLADALVWADEVPFRWRRGEIEDCLRALWHHRTGLIIGEARPFGELWQLGTR